MQNWPKCGITTWKVAWPKNRRSALLRKLELRRSGPSLEESIAWSSFVSSLLNSWQATRRGLPKSPKLYQMEAEESQKWNKTQVWVCVINFFRRPKRAMSSLIMMSHVNTREDASFCSFWPFWALLCICPLCHLLPIDVSFLDFPFFVTFS